MEAPIKPQQAALPLPTVDERNDRPPAQPTADSEAKRKTEILVKSEAEHHRVVQAIVDNTAEACKRLNAFTLQMFQTRGGRIGSGMGAVIEGLWGFFLNQILAERVDNKLEMAWMFGHEYNDFACVDCGLVWDPVSRAGELLRVEVKSMIASADESKAHFDRLEKELTDSDLLAVFLWDWVEVKKPGGQKTNRVCPQVKNFFIGKALDVARLRDALHQARGGSFVEAGCCPDGCSGTCKHVGEPLNASKRRERLSGPEQSRVSQSVSYAANFGGLVRMLKCSSQEARKIFREICRENETAWMFVSFVFQNLPAEEENQYSKADWLKVAGRLDLEDIPADKSALVKAIRASGRPYREILRGLP